MNESLDVQTRTIYWVVLSIRGPASAVVRNLPRCQLFQRSRKSRLRMKDCYNLLLQLRWIIRTRKVRVATDSSKHSETFRKDLKYILVKADEANQIYICTVVDSHPMSSSKNLVRIALSYLKSLLVFSYRKGSEYFRRGHAEANGWLSSSSLIIYTHYRKWCPGFFTLLRWENKSCDLLELLHHKQVVPSIDHS